mgnify:CR=1 FL=1
MTGTGGDSRVLFEDLADAFEWLVSILQGRPDLMPQGFPAEPYPQA